MHGISAILFPMNPAGMTARTHKTRKFAVLISLLAAMPILLSSCIGGRTDTAKTQARDGKMDLAGYSFDDNRIVPLAGAWLFWPNRLLSTDEVRAEIEGGYHRTTTVPGLWSKTGVTGRVADLIKNGNDRARADHTNQSPAIGDPVAECGYGMRTLDRRKKSGECRHRRADQKNERPE